MWIDRDQTPAESLGSKGTGDLGRPVVIGISIVQRVVKWCLHQTCELGAKTGLVRVYIAFSFPPFCPPVFEPYLLIGKT